jgi:hypothetical protein
MKNLVIKTIYIFVLATSVLVSTNLLAQSIITKNEFTRASIDTSGQLKITPSKNSSSHDFDFLIGKWKLEHKKLRSRLTNSDQWDEFETIVEDFSILEGTGNMDVGRALFDGKPWEGRTLRLFNQETRLWSLYWMTSDTGVLFVPMVGSFDGNIGWFYSKEKYNGRDILALFKWDKTDPENPVWSQAFSADNGLTWEWNWTNTSRRIK